MLPQLLYYMQPSGNECLKNNHLYNLFSVFNFDKEIKGTDLKNNKSEIILKLIFASEKINRTGITGFGVDVNKTKLMVLLL